MKEKLKAFWEELNPDQKRNLVVVLVAVTFIGFLIIANKTDPPSPTGATTIKKRTISLEDDVLKKSIFAATNEKLEKERKRSEKELRGAKKEIDDLKNLLGELKKDLVQGNYPNPKKTGATYPPPVGSSSSVRFTPNPNAANQPVTTNTPGNFTNSRPVNLQGKNPKEQRPRGGIASVEAPSPPVEPKSPAKKSRNYLPISIVKATTLTGIHAVVSEQGMSNPQPVILRISKPAILPNRIRKNITGCFVIAEGFGSLATERVELRTRTISCLSADGRAVIEEPVKGFVVDGDGNLGLSGRVVARFGSALARNALAGFFEGVGQLTADSTQTTTTDITGQKTQQVGANDIAKGSLGKGLQKATGEVGKFYLDLAKQSLPVVEILPGKKVDIVITEGMELKVNES